MSRLASVADSRYSHGMNDRQLAFEGVENFRDFGGYATTTGATLRRGRLFRSGHHNRATDADLARFDQLGIATVVDLRRSSERQDQPSRRSPGFGGLVIENPDAEIVEAPHVSFLRNTDLTEDAVRGFMIETYRAMPFDPRHQAMFRRYFEALQAGEGAVVIHCAAGKDRTGLLAALTHHALGVSRDDLMQDYLATNAAVRLQERAPEIRRHIQKTYGRPASDEAVIAFLGVEPAFIESAFAAIDARHGSLDGYLAEVLGVDAAARERLAARLTDQKAR
ncbi:MAG TPA: tyrosine-protein phosphatase [Caulobacteraceae bacterium]|jgi:protein tyrosine/serine phosphatase|nr:tyrosine-protein phosphatase [Caulobacteraceae bacterium]